MKASIETITPTQAEAWLALNDHNRSLRPDVVNRLAGAILRDEWVLNGESIKLNGKRLLDGQHRLAAIIKAGKPVQSLVVRDLPIEAQETVDIVARRTLADVLRLRGQKHSNMLAGALVQIFQWRTQGRIGRTSAATYPTIQQALSLFHSEPGIEESLAVGQLVKQRLRYPPALATAIYHILTEIDRDDAADFWERLANGVRLDEGDPIWTLRQALDQPDPRRGITKEKLAALTIKAWNAYRDGATIQRLRWSPGGSKPEPFPHPV